MSPITTRPPKSYTEGRDFERWMYNIWKKLGDSDTTFEDIDMRSMNPVLGMLQDLTRKYDSLKRDGRNLKAELETMKRTKQENAVLRARVTELEKRIVALEEEIT